jgi:hypothetical protein
LARMKQEQGPRSGLESVLIDVGVFVGFAVAALAVVACCGPTGPRDPAAPCKTFQLGVDIDAATSDTTFWSEYRCPDGSEWHQAKDGPRYRIK